MESMTFEQFCEEIPDDQKPWMDRKESIEKEKDEELNCKPFLIKDDSLRERLAKSGNALAVMFCLLERWMDNGVLLLRDFIPANLIDAYTARYQQDNGENARLGYNDTGTPYMRVQEIKDLCLYRPLTEILESIIGEPMGMSLNLCNWESTERNWHQDDYLNPPEVNGHYLAVWIALDDIHPDSGPFEFVPGSHKWPVMRGEKVRAALEPDERTNPDWPRTAERFLDDVFEREIEKRGAKIRVWDDAKKGDVLIWHSWLAHRGSKPKNSELLRKSLICHYSGIHHRPDMQPALLYENGESKGYFFPF